MRTTIQTGQLTNQLFECNISAPIRVTASNIVKRNVIVYWPDPDEVVPIDRFEVFGRHGEVATAWTGDTMSQKLKAQRKAIAKSIRI